MINKIEKLGFAVVYLISERNERLLDIHLEYIAKHTKVPFQIYGSAVSLPSQFLPKLEANPNVMVCPVEPYDDSGEKPRRFEHSWYLEQLLRFAFEDGCSHTMILHVDSFPICDGWAQQLAAKLNDRCVMAGIVRDEERDWKPMSAGIFQHRDFWAKHKPQLLPTEEELASPQYAKYKEEVPHSSDSGSGYGYALYRHGLEFAPLLQSNAGDRYAHYGSIYGDMIFHLNAAMQMENGPEIAYGIRVFTQSPLRRMIGRTARCLLPDKVRLKLKSQLPSRVTESERHRQKMSFEEQRKLLLSDPEAYIDYLRSRPRKEETVHS